MSGLIKAEAANARGAVVRPLAGPTPRPGAPTPEEDERAALALEVEALRARLARQDAAISAHSEALAKAQRDAQAKGRLEGLRERDARTEGLLVSLKEGLSAADTAFRAELVSLERLAVLIAETALQKVLGDPLRHADLVALAVTRQVSDLAAGAVLRAEVSSEDFEADGSLEDSFAGVSGLEVIRSDELASGEARLVLRLGGLDVGVSQQWSRLRAVLSRMSEAQA